MSGRPSKYDPAFCDEVLPFMSQGYSTTALAGHLGVSRSTVYLWMEENPAFSDAVKEGMAASARWWEDCLRQNAMTGQGNATSAIFGLKNRAADDWRDKRDVDHTTNGKDMPQTVIYQIPDNGRGDQDG
jgi:hypothetical protein